jgi:hypothetical protein
MIDTSYPVVTTFVCTAETVEASTLVTVAEAVEAPPLRPADQLAPYLYDDLRVLMRATHLRLDEALGVPDEYADDPELFLRLLCADLENLVREQLLSSITLVLADAVGTEGREVVRYRASYQIRRTLDDEALGRPFHPITRTGRRAPSSHGAEDTVRFSLVLEWSQAATKPRRNRIGFPRYHFTWVRSAAARFEERRATPGQSGRLSEKNVIQVVPSRPEDMPR